MRVQEIRPVTRYLGLLTGVVLLALGALMLTHRPGLRLEYYASPRGAEAAPVFSDIGMPQLAGRREVADVLVSQEIFRLRWRGWLRVDRAGEYRFLIDSDEASYLRLDERLQASTTRDSRSAESDGLRLKAGIHPVEIGFSQTGGRARLEVRWGRVGEEPEVLQGGYLVARQPAALRAWLQNRLSAAESSLLPLVSGLLALLAGMAVLVRSLGPLRPALDRGASSIRGWIREPPRKQAVHAAFLLAVFVATFLLVLPYTASTTDGDDIRYMDGARFNKQMGWNLNRYAHIYALKVFIWGANGDAYQASRVYWAASFAATVLGLAVAARALGAGLQIGVLAVALFLLLAQPYVFGGIGAAYADYSAMMFVTLGLAVYLHGFGRRDSSSTGWHAAALGALTVAAAKSKEPGLILLWLALGMMWSGTRIDWRRFGKRLMWWSIGAGGAYVVLMTLDGWVLGDFWFSLRSESLAGFQRLRSAAEEIWQLSRWAWLEVAWTRGSLRNLSALAVLTAIVSSARPWSPALRWVAWMPLAFLSMMIAIHPPISSPRYLFPIIPVACFSGAMLFHDLTSKSRAGKARRRGVAIALMICLLAFFGSGILDTWGALARHRTAQRGDWTLYPWQAFRQEIEAARPKEIIVSPRLYGTYQMIGKSRTRDRIARLYFQRRHLRLRQRQDLRRLPEIAVLTRREYRRLLALHPELERTAVFDPSGQIVLVRSEVSGEAEP